MITNKTSYIFAFYMRAVVWKVFIKSMCVLKISAYQIQYHGAGKQINQMQYDLKDLLTSKEWGLVVRVEGKIQKHRRSKG